ncbi:MAG: transposase [Enhygromyxa sp.]
MTKPRCVLPGLVYLITRRCSERRFFLLPDPIVRQIFEYLLGLLANKYGVAVHAYVVMSNHYHLVVTDTQGRMPDFQRDLNSLLARAMNRYRVRREAFWSRESYSGVKLLEPGDVISKMAYTLANPVKARLVERASEWEGATSAGVAFGRARRIARPEKFFRDSMPEEVELVLTRPGGFEGVGDAELLERVRADVARREALHANEGEALGMAGVREQGWRSSPESFEPLGQMNPTIAGKNKWVRIEALQRAKEWLSAYYDALKRFVGGEREVEFPPGTWEMRVRLRCSVAES